jgi:hypothetical protein
LPNIGIVIFTYWGALTVVDDNSSSLDEKKRLTQRQEIFSVSSQFSNVEMRGERNGYPS